MLHTGPEAIVLGGYVTGLWVARALARRGIRVTVVEGDRADIAGYSRSAAERVPCRGAALDVDELLALLDRRAGSWAGRVLVPTGDVALEAVARGRDALLRTYRLCVPPWDIVRTLLRKDETYRLARATGVDLPVSYGALTSDLARNPALLYPVIVKPNDSRRFHRHFATKVLLATDGRHLAELAAKVRAAGLCAEVLELIPGPDSLSFNYTAYLDAQGEPLAEFAIHKLRKSPPFFGIARVVEPLVDPGVVAELRRRSLALLRAARWHGPVSAEFKRDPRDGRLLLMEVNGRCSFVQQLALAAGIDYPWLLYQEAVFGQAAPQTPTAWDGVLVHLYADLLNTLLFHRVEGLSAGEYLAPYLRRKMYAVWRLRDPLPFLVEWGRTLRKSLDLLRNADARRRLFARAVPIPHPTAADGRADADHPHTRATRQTWIP